NSSASHRLKFWVATAGRCLCLPTDFFVAATPQEQLFVSTCGNQNNPILRLPDEMRKTWCLPQELLVEIPIARPVAQANEICPDEVACRAGEKRLGRR